MTSSSWSPDYTTSGCWRSESIYEGPEKTRNGNRFVICASLDAGAEKYFSGVHLVVCCEDTDDLKSLVGVLLTKFQCCLRGHCRRSRTRTGGAGEAGTVRRSY